MRTRRGRIELLVDAQGQVTGWRLEAYVGHDLWTHTTGEVGPFDTPGELADALAVMLATDIRWPDPEWELGQSEDGSD